jgi:hypothetical protein
MYHLELRQFPHNLCRFNLTEQQLRAVVEPWAAEKVVDIGERKWSPHQAKLTILEGPQLAVAELSMGRGWRAAQRQSANVTERIMGLAQEAAEQAARKALEEAGRAALAAEGAQEAGAAEVAEVAGVAGVADVAGVAEVAGGDVEAEVEAEAAETEAYESGAGGRGEAVETPVDPAAGVVVDPLALGVQMASLLGSDPTRLLEAWRAVAAGAPGLAPSESLAVAEQRLAKEDSANG